MWQNKLESNLCQDSGQSVFMFCSPCAPRDPVSPSCWLCLFVSRCVPSLVPSFSPLLKPSVFLCLALPEYLLLLLEQGERSLEDHTRLFLALAYLTMRSAHSTTTKRIPAHRLFRGGSRQYHSRYRALPAISLLCGVHAWAHQWRKAWARRDRWAIAARSDRAVNGPGTARG